MIAFSLLIYYDQIDSKFLGLKFDQIATKILLFKTFQTKIKRKFII